MAWTEKYIELRTELFVRAQRAIHRIREEIVRRSYENPTSFYKSLLVLDELRETQQSLGKSTGFYQLKKAEERIEKIELSEEN